MSDVPQNPAAPSAGGAPPSSHLPAPIEPPPAPQNRVLASVAHVLGALRFYSRLPVPAMSFETAPHAPVDFDKAPVAVVLAGALLGAIAAAVLLTAGAIGLPPFLSAILAVAALAIVTGAMHEDGLADTADGLGGGQTAERRLEIMRDSRIGSYGATAIGLSLAMRATALAALIERLDAPAAALAVIAVAATSRAAGLVPLWLLPPARSTGAAASVTPPASGAMIASGLCCLAITIAALWMPGVLVIASALSVALAYASAYAMTRIAEAMIGGHTGDIAGAAQQLAEIAMLLTLVAASTVIV